MRQLGQFLIGLYLAIYGISLITDPWTQLHYDRSIRQIGLKTQNYMIGLALNLRWLYGFAHIFSGYCLMNNIKTMKALITSTLIIDVLIQFGFNSIHQLFQNVILIGIINYI